MASLIRKFYTLTLIRSGNKVLLGFKKRGFGQGKWNAFGGKVEKGESLEEAAIREVHEESGIEIVGGVEKVGELEFTFEGESNLMDVHVFAAKSFKGEPVETEEMRPQWFPIEDLPYSQMWPDDYLWYPIILKGGKFRGAFHFQGHDIILSQKLEEVNEFA
ncbi:Nudix (Nucleoside diphosphate linked moiety X)-type motif 1 [Halocaridina rubra]|uniref:Oxidized purine nucleoside triphosphate hydrolase n=1 Tax=Halocaridina rubra TaxID=373956 RepID=A0AAN8WHN5_HALRR